MSTLYSIRCPEDRKHSSKHTGVEHSTCGHLLAILDDEYLYLRCPICKIIWKVKDLKGGAVEMEPISKEKKLELESSLKVIPYNG